MAGKCAVHRAGQCPEGHTASGIGLGSRPLAPSLEPTLNQEPRRSGGANSPPRSRAGRPLRQGARLPGRPGGTPCSVGQTRVPVRPGGYLGTPTSLQRPAGRGVQGLEGEGTAAENCTWETPDNTFQIPGVVSTFLMFFFFLGDGQDLFWPQTHAVQLPDVSAAPACPRRERHGDQGGCGCPLTVRPLGNPGQPAVGLRLTA